MERKTKWQDVFHSCNSAALTGMCHFLDVVVSGKGFVPVGILFSLCCQSFVSAVGLPAVWPITKSNLKGEKIKTGLKLHHSSRDVGQHQLFRGL